MTKKKNIKVKRREEPRPKVRNDRPTFSRKKQMFKKQGRPKSEAVAKLRAETIAKIERTFPIELMMTDFAIKYPDLSPKQYAVDVKGYTDKEWKKILAKAPEVDWYQARREIQDSITAGLVKRQIDWAAEMHDQQFQASRISMESAIAWLEAQRKRKPEDLDIRMLKTATEIVQLAQKIQRVALGLPSDDGAVHIYNSLILAKREERHVRESEKTPVEKLQESLTLDEIQELIEHRRVEKRREREREQDRTIDVESTTRE